MFHIIQKYHDDSKMYFIHTTVKMDIEKKIKIIQNQSDL